MGDLNSGLGISGCGALGLSILVRFRETSFAIFTQSSHSSSWVSALWLKLQTGLRVPETLNPKPESEIIFREPLPTAVSVPPKDLHDKQDLKGFRVLGSRILGF